MNDKYSLDNIDSLLFQLALETRELSQKKNEINQQIKVCRADIAEKKSYIGELHRRIEKLEEEIGVKQSTVTRNKGNAKRMKTTNGLLLQYEQTLKAELETRKASYNHDVQVFEERIASYRKTFQEHKDYYLQSPLAEKLLLLQAEKEEIECRIKAWDEQITMKQKELDHLSGPVVTSFSTEKLPDSFVSSAFGLQPVTEQEKLFDHQTAEDRDSSIDISSLHLNQTRKGYKTSDEEANAEVIHEGNIQDSSTCCTSPEKPSQQLCEQSQPEEMHTEEQEEETSQEDQEKLLLVSHVEEVLKSEMEKGVATHEEQALSDKDNEELAASDPEAFPAKMTSVSSTPTFSFNFSPASSQDQRPSETKSPAFLFSLNSDSNTAGFSGFGFDVGSSQEEDSFGFTRSLFTEKVCAVYDFTGPQFLFDQPEQCEDFQFAFGTKSPQSTKKESTGDDFPFSFNF
ncbi:restin homolog isoform X2 [Archocentrus centrarchus]|uniref:restin homolog isoform X2 n=1 Tax=Archocentrus centrarchus TaxID=63155 RepID=UPI0011EA02B0|nr:restin homolog isoform X2 [Archocentrus centrarchus]